MKHFARLLPALLLCACSSVPRPFMLDDSDRRSSHRDNPEEAERKANEAIRDIQNRIARGDLPKIQFEFDKDAITPESFQTLDLIKQVLLADEHLKLSIFAHTDSVGSEAYNDDLSQRRAKAVKTWLAYHGVPPPSMRYHGYGFSRPIADNATDEGRAKNRRVEFYVTVREWKAVY